LAGERGGLDADGSVSLVESSENDDRSSNRIFTRSEHGDRFIEKNRLQPPSIIKIDVEGAEGSVIDGLSNTIQRPECRLVYCEVHEQEVAYDTINSKLESFGFDVSIIDERDYGRTIKARKKHS
jgi:hypothetical protein